MTAWGGPSSTPEQIAKEEAMPQWEQYARWTQRLPVAGGWLYRYGITTADAMVFVPDANAPHTRRKGGEN